MLRTGIIVLAVVLAVCLPLAAWSEDAKPPLSKYQDVRPAEQQWTSAGAAAGARWLGGQGGFRMAGAPCVAAVLAPPPPQIVDNLATRLNLTDEQKGKLKTTLENARTKLEPLRTRLNESATAVRKALMDPDKDAAAVKALVEAAQKVEAEVSAAELSAWLEVRSSLDKDQLETLGESMGPRVRPTGPAPGGPMPGPGGPPPGPGAPPPPPPPGE